MADWLTKTLPPVCRVDARERGKRKPAPWIGDGPCGRGTTPVHRCLTTAALRLVADSVARRRDVGRGNGGQTGDSYWAVSVWDARSGPRWDAATPAHAGAVGIAAQRSCSNGLPAPPSHQSRLAEPAEGRLLVLVIAMGPCAGEEEQKTTTDVVVEVHIAHLAGCSPAGIGTRRMLAGCRASKGRFPPPLWMSAGLHSLVAGTIAGWEGGCQEGPLGRGEGTRPMSHVPRREDRVQ
jgi:hypothetical protein